MIVLFKYVVGKCFVMFSDVFSFPPGVCVGTLNLIASSPGSSIHTFPSVLYETFLYFVL